MIWEMHVVKIYWQKMSSNKNFEPLVVYSAQWKIKNDALLAWSSSKVDYGCFGNLIHAAFH